MYIHNQLCMLALVGMCGGFTITDREGNQYVDRESFINRIASAVSHRQDASDLSTGSSQNNENASPQYQQLKQSAVDYVENNLLKNIQERFGSTNLANNEELYKTLTHLVGESELFQFIQNMKRTPEVFSQDLYPLQHGAQQTEANLDKTLGPLIDHPDTVAIVAARVTETSDYTDKADDALKTDTAIQKESGQTESTSKRGKRWWALDQLRRYRTPKSFSFKKRPRRLPKVDPVVYFLGLGK